MPIDIDFSLPVTDFGSTTIPLPEITDMDQFNIDWNNWEASLPQLNEPDLSDVFHSNYLTEGQTNMFNPDVNSGSWFNFNQEDMSQSMQDVLNGAWGGVKSGLQSIVSDAPKAGQTFLSQFIRGGTQKFLSTATGQQVEQAAIQQRINQLLGNPLVIFGGAILIVVLFMMLARRA